jgi:chorismate lyase
MCWHPVETISLPASLNAWLTERGSLTKKFRAALGENYQLTLLGESFQPIGESDAMILNLPIGEKVKIREIFMGKKNKPLIYCRTYLPQKILNNKTLGLDQLGGNSLGDVLFQEATLKRSAIFVKQLTETDVLFQTLKQHIKPTTLTQKPWARYSVFSIDGDSLLVFEVFFTDFYPNVSAQ